MADFGSAGIPVEDESLPQDERFEEDDEYRERQEQRSLLRKQDDDLDSKIEEEEHQHPERFVKPEKEKEENVVKYATNDKKEDNFYNQNHGNKEMYDMQATPHLHQEHDSMYGSQRHAPGSFDLGQGYQGGKRQDPGYHP